MGMEVVFTVMADCVQEREKSGNNISDLRDSYHVCFRLVRQKNKKEATYKLI